MVSPGLPDNTSLGGMAVMVEAAVTEAETVVVEEASVATEGFNF